MYAVPSQEGFYVVFFVSGHDFLTSKLVTVNGCYIPNYFKHFKCRVLP